MLTVKLFERFLLERHPDHSPSADIFSIIGLVTLGALLSYYSLFFKLGDIYPHALVISLTIITFVAFPRDWKKLLLPSDGRAFNRENVVLVLPFAIGIILCSVQAPILYDTALYQAQAIQWIEKYACVPGLVNLHGRLAFNSSSLVLSAFYGFSFLGGQTYYTLNPYLYMLFTFSILMNIKTMTFRGDYQRAFILTLLFIIFYSVAGHKEFSPTSPSTDIMPVVLIAYLFLALSRYTDLLNDTSSLVLVAFVPASLVTVKLSQIPIMLFTAGLLYNKSLKYSQRFFLAAVPSVFILLPWLLRNIIISGYLVYPLPQVDLFSFDWKVPQAGPLSEQQWIKSWAIMPFKQANEVLALPLKDWLFPWFGRLSALYKTLVMGMFISPVIIGTGFIMNKLRKEIALFWLVCFIGCMFWFVSAPDVRFAFGFIIFCAAIPLSLLVGFLKKVQPKKLYGAVLVLIVIIGIVDVILPCIRTFQSLGPSRVKEFFWNPETLKKVDLTYKKARNVVVSVPIKGDQCFAAPIPCTPYFNPNLQKRGNSLQDGFRIAVSDDPNDVFAPSEAVSLGQVSVFIIRAKYGETFDYTASPYFSDVPDTHGFFKYVQKMKDTGITAATGNYDVDGVVTREHMAVFLSKAF